VTVTAKDVQTLRQLTGVGMMDAKKALEANDGDMQAATQWLRVQGLASAAKRSVRDASEGAVAVVRNGSVAAIAELRCETDFVGKSPKSSSHWPTRSPRACAPRGEGAVSEVSIRD